MTEKEPNMKRDQNTQSSTATAQVKQVDSSTQKEERGSDI